MRGGRGRGVRGARKERSAGGGVEGVREEGRERSVGKGWRE